MYIVFAGYEYYPGGGINDWVGSYSSLDDAVAEAKNDDHDWAQICTFDGNKFITVWDTAMGPIEKTYQIVGVGPIRDCGS